MPIIKKDKKKKESFKEGWRVLFLYLFKYKREVIILSFLGVLSALANGSVPYVIGQFFDSILSSKSVFLDTSFEMPSWLFFLFIFFTIQFLADFIGWIINKSSRKVVTGIYADYKIRSIKKIIKFKKDFFVNKKIGEIIELGQRASSAADNISFSIIIRLTPQIMSIFVGFVFSFYINIYLGLIILLGVLIYSVIFYLIISPMPQKIRISNKLFKRAYSILFSSINNPYVVKSFSSEKFEINRSEKAYFKARDFWFGASKIWDHMSFSQSVIVTLTRISVFITSVFLIQNGVISIGDLIALNGYAMLAFGPFIQMGYQWNQIQNGLVAIDDYEKILELPPENYHPKDAIKMNEIKGNVEFKDVSFYYEKKDGNVLKDINMEVKAGQTVALVGESGVGKSTLIDLISAYYFAQKGKVLIDGVDIKKIDLEFLRKNIAIVPQEVSLFNDTIKNNIKYGSFGAKDKEVIEVSKLAHADKFIEKFPKKYRQVVGERGVKLSVGQKQRVAIARAMLRDPKILILDEPTSALDSKTEVLITESLEKLMKGRTTFIVAHRLSTVRKADKIFVFKDGKIIESGSHEDLVKIDGGEHQRLYNLHVGLS